MGTLQPLNVTINVFARVYLNISAAGKGMSATNFQEGLLIFITAAGSHTVVKLKIDDSRTT